MARGRSRAARSPRATAQARLGDRGPRGLAQGTQWHPMLFARGGLRVCLNPESLTLCSVRVSFRCSKCLYQFSFEFSLGKNP